MRMAKKLASVLLAAAIILSSIAVEPRTAMAYSNYSYSYSYTSLDSVTLSTSSVSINTVLTQAITFITSQEGTYSSVTANDNGALSIGILQWNGNNALKLLRVMVSADNETAYSMLGSTLYNEVISASSWSSRVLTSSEKSAVSAYINTSANQAIQDKMAVSYVSSYLNTATNLGIRNAGALLIFADVANQRGVAKAESTAGIAKSLAGSYSSITANEMLMASIYNYSTSSTTAYSSFVSRRLASYKYVAITLGWSYGDILIPYSGWSAQSAGAKWIQSVLNKINNAGLTVDGYYGSATQAAVTAYQKSRGLTADGSVSVLTIASMIDELCEYTITGSASYTSSGSGSDSASSSTLSISSYSCPTTITKGSTYSITGTITSGSKITKVTVNVLDSTGTAVLSISETPNATSYNIGKLDGYISFESLSAGTYTYQVTASDANGMKVLICKSFKVTSSSSSSASSSTLSISSYSCPTTITKGSTYSITGTITSGSKITKVTVNVLDSTGTAVLSISETPNATSYNIGKLDGYISFESLSAGTYTYQVTASDANGMKVLICKSFKVK